MKVYLAGPIYGRTDEEAHAWRRKAKKVIQCECVDPAERDYRGREDEHFREIVETDKEQILQSDLLLAMVSSISVGTIMEIIFAHEHGKRVYVVNPLSNRSPWLRYHSDRQFVTLSDAIWAINIEARP